MRKSPTDLALLEHMYSKYYDRFAEFLEPTRQRPTKNYVPIDVAEIAKHFGVDGDIVFGRFYYHLQEKFGIRRENNVTVPFFEFHDGWDIDCRHQVQFPMLASAIASLREARNQYLVPTLLSAGSLILSIVALCVGFLI